MRVFVTGSNGFIGSATVRAALDRGWEVAGLVRPGSNLDRLGDLRSSIRFIQGSLDDRDGWLSEVQGYAPDAVIHLAWYAEPGLYPTSIQNLSSLSNTLSLITDLPSIGSPYFCGVGSCFEYDFSQGWLSESSDCRPGTLYGACKLAASTTLPLLATELGIQASWVRPFYQFGPFEDSRRLIPAVIRRLLNGDRAEVIEGRMIRDYSHVDDVGGGICAVVSRSLTGVVNLGSGQPVSVRRVLEQIGELTDRLDLIQFGARQSNFDEPEFIVSNNARLRTEAGFSPTYDCFAGLKHTIEWWKAHSKRKE